MTYLRGLGRCLPQRRLETNHSSRPASNEPPHNVGRRRHSGHRFLSGSIDEVGEGRSLSLENLATERPQLGDREVVLAVVRPPAANREVGFLLCGVHVVNRGQQCEKALVGCTASSTLGVVSYWLRSVQSRRSFV